MAENKIKRTTWRTNRTWDLQGMAKAMYDWLSSLVPGLDGSSGFKGFELAGTLNPADPDPTKYKQPPKWMTPELMMQGACAWQAGAMQEFLLLQGLIPLVRARVSSAGELNRQAGASVAAVAGKFPGGGFYLLLDQEETDYPIGGYSTAVITPRVGAGGIIGGTATAVSAVQSRIRWDDAGDAAAVEEAFYPEDPPFFEQYAGWVYSFSDGGEHAVDIHVFL